MKWICKNCGNVFESDNGNEKDDYRIHIEDCYDIFEKFEVIFE